MSFLIERRVAEHRREPPIAVMQRAMDDDDELPEHDPLEQNELHDPLDPHEQHDPLDTRDQLETLEPTRSEEEDGDHDWDWEDDDEPDVKRVKLDE